MNEVIISQTGRSRLNTLRVTSDHNFFTLSGPKLVKKKISKILEERKSVLLADRLPEYNRQFIDLQLAYIMGALLADGYISIDPIPRVMFIQKKDFEKLDFINYVQDCFQNIFQIPLREVGERIGGGFIRGKLMQGTAVDFICTKTLPAQTLVGIKEDLIPWVLSLTEDATLNFLAGVIDGDGTWNPKHKVIDIFCGKEKVAPAIVLACLKLGILPYISKQRGNCYIIQISERVDEITKYTQRVKSEPHLRKYGTKLFSARQLFKGAPDLKWPFLHKAKRNNLMSKENILRHLNTPSNKKRYSGMKDSIEKIVSSPLRMQRVKKNKDLGMQEVFNITVEDNHNYIVLTDLFFPVLVANCHGAGRTMSRHAAMRRVSGQEVVSRLEQKGIIIKCWSMRGIAEEAPMAYKDVDNVVQVVHNAGLSKKVARLVPLAVIKGE